MLTADVAMATPLKVIDTHIHLNKCYSGGLPNQWVQEWCGDWSEEAHKDYSEAEMLAQVRSKTRET